MIQKVKKEMVACRGRIEINAGVKNALYDDTAEEEDKRLGDSVIIYMSQYLQVRSTLRNT